MIDCRHKPRILFVLKKRLDRYGVPIGLINSARFVTDALELAGIDTRLAIVDDNNCIDREVSKYKPTHVVIEALWVVPSKLEVLVPRHPKVKWMVRLHSKTPFLAMEGIAMKWIIEYAEIAKKFGGPLIATNSTSLQDDLLMALGIRSIYMPNIYRLEPYLNCLERQDPWMDIGCFGAIRPLKNHLLQAMAAKAFGKETDKGIRFHINANRVEQRADTILSNLRALESKEFNVVEHPWMEHNKFLRLVQKMDMGMQVSMSESFNIVTADFVNNSVPIIVSKDVTWMPDCTQADTNSLKDIVDKLGDAAKNKKKFVRKSLEALDKYNETSLKAWIKTLSK